MKKLLSLLLATLMICSLFSVSIFAQAATAQPKFPSKETKSSTITIDLKKLVTKEINPQAYSAGRTITFKIKNAEANAKITYTSSKKNVAEFDKSHKLLCKSKGDTKITITIKGKKLGKIPVYCWIRVLNNPSLTIKGKAFKSSTEYSVAKGKTITAVIKGKVASLANGYSVTKIAAITSSASATKVQIKGLDVGKATVLIKVNNIKTFKIKIKVS